MRKPFFLFNQPSAIKACTGCITEAGIGIGGYYEEIDTNRGIRPTTGLEIIMLKHCPQSTRREIGVTWGITDRLTCRCAGVGYRAAPFL